MEIYRSVPQKSSNLPSTKFEISYGLSRSVAAQAVKHGMSAHIRIYEAGLRLGLEQVILTGADLVAWLSAHDIELSRAQAQRVLVDRVLFEQVGEYRSGKRGRPTKLYRMMPPLKVGQHFGIPMGASYDAPYLAAADLSSAMRYRLAIFGRGMVWMEESSRAAQVKFWARSKPTLIRWTQEVSLIAPQIQYVRSDQLSYTAPMNGDAVFLYDVRQREDSGSHKYWLEVVDEQGEIRKLPCKRAIAERWYGRSVVTICEQVTNRYRIHAAYRDPPIWERGEPLPY